jgi:energy-coupling factor transporter ATP-binding protein EcfA2
MAKFNKFLSEAQKILNDKKLIKNEIDNIQQQQNEIIIKHKRISDIFKKRREKTNELIRIKRYKNNPRLKLTETNRKRLQAHILKLEGELNILAEKTKLFKGGRTRRMKKNVKKITNKKKTSIKAKTRRIRRRKTCRRRN